jgi:hypothetical protein
LLVSLVLAMTSLAASAASSKPVAGAGRQVAAEPAAPPAAPTVTFDDFNRTVANGWGTSTFGIPWVNILSPLSWSMTVDGTAGKMVATTDLESGGGLPPGHGGSMVAATNSSTVPWRQPGWMWTSTFKISTVPTTDVSSVWFEMTGNGGYPIASAVELGISSGPGGGVAMIGAGSASASVPKTDWLANTWYTVKFVHVWRDQSRVKVWPSSQGEPTQWLASRDAQADTYGQENTTYPMVTSQFAVPTTTWFDDFIFADPPVLPKVPSPPDTEFNPPYLNSEDTGDPVSSFTGAFSDPMSTPRSPDAVRPSPLRAPTTAMTRG